MRIVSRCSRALLALGWSAALSAGIFLGSASAQAQSVQGVSDSEIVLGSVLDLSGPVASIGGPIRDGMTMAVEEINAGGGVHGRKLRLVIEDSGYDPKKGVMVTQKLLTQDKVFAMIATVGSAVVQATMPMLMERGVPSLFATASSEVAYLPYHPLKFGMMALSSNITRARVRYAYEKLGKRRFSMIYQDDETGLAMFRATEEQLKTYGLSLVERATYKRGDTNFSAQVARLKAANPDIVILGTIVREAPAVAIEARTQGWPVDIFTPTLTAGMITLGGQAVEGMYGTTSFAGLAQEMTPEYKAIVDRYKARFGRDLPDSTYYGYASVMLFGEGARNAGRNLTPQTLSQGLEQVRDFKTAFDGPAQSYKPGDHSPSPAAIVMQVRNGKWVILERNYRF